ncbi:very short patch repair endonuclease [Sphingopyxis sp.]|uniref:very short patch repair endonuclease n=1 Tax=Sphingopyxis sp. TaxID=1908224 RepID=UPI003D0EF929
MDKISREARAANMRAIKSRDTKPEIIVRRLAHSLGYRFRLHRKDLPGKPDMVFVARRKAIFVHGCFWHQHPDDRCLDGRMPRTRLEYWQPKLARNQEREIKKQFASSKIWGGACSSFGNARRKTCTSLKLD